MRTTPLLLAGLLSFVALRSSRAAPPPEPRAAPPPEPVAAPPLLRGEQEFNSCLRLPRDHAIRVMLKPESEIADVIAWISAATCKGFIVAPGRELAGRKVSVLAPEAISAGEAYRLFLALLETVNLTVEPVGRFLRIIETSKSARALLPIYPAGQIPAAEAGVITRLVRLEHAQAADVAAILQGYRGEHGAVVAYPATGTLILTDRAATIERLVVLIAALDVPGEELRLWTLPARHVSAVDLGQTLADLVGAPFTGPGGARRGAPAAAPPPTTAAKATTGIARLVPDDRAGRLLVVATDAAFARLAALAVKLDVPAETRAAKVHAYRCRHADCDAVASILGTLAGVNVARGPAPEGARNRPAAATPAPAPAAAAERAAPPLFAGEVRVTSDPSTNALLVLSSLDDFRALGRLIEEIDVPRKQVFVEATIMEVVRDKERNVGVAFHGGAGRGEAAGIAGFNAGQSMLLDQSALGSALVGLSGLAVGAPLEGVAQALGLPTTQVPSLGAFIHLLQKDQNVDLIANPHLLITNNHEGQISVGQRVPVQGAFTGSVGGAAVGSLLPTVSINREDVALTLKLTPHVNDDGLIRLEIDQEMSELGATDPLLGPSTSRRTTNTTVFVRDQQTIVIGGLMRERQTDNATKVPVLGDLPLLGFLFRSTSKVTQKQNIILALTPYVINEPSDLTRVLEAKLRDRREFLRLYGSDQERDQERRLIDGPLGRPRTVGMLELINRAAKSNEASIPSPTATATATAPEGLPLP